MTLQSLGYVGFQGQDVAAWSEFATSLLGMEVVDQSQSGLTLRMDNRKQRVVIDRSGAAGSHIFGWEVADRSALDALAAHLESRNVRVGREPGALAAQRCVTELISFADPVGNRLEAFHGPMLADFPFRPGRNISGFRTGPLGMGHAVLTVERIDDVMPFYVDVLGFRLSDFALRPFKAYFFHINGRHHSLALVETGKNGLHHLMVELFSLDDVGQGYDLAQGDPGRVAVTLGRHTNDLMTSFYAKSPGDFMIEYGWGGREIEPSTWQPFECTYGPSLWGHERSWLGPNRRAEARGLRLRAASEGMREPVQVLAGNHTLMPGTCPWWDATLGAAE
jgi:2,3-dihydroxybiphenyl 1,2-dioxygenase